MNNDDRFVERLQHDAQPLRFEPDDMMAVRIAARVRARIATPAPTAAQFLARWLRPLAATFSAIVLAATVSVFWLDRATSETPSIESLSAGGSIEISAAGDVYRVSE